MQNKKPRNPGKESATKLGRRSLVPLVTIRKKYFKFYFTIKAIENLELRSNKFIIRKEKTDWFLIVSSSKNAKRLTQHNGAYYFVDRKLAKVMFKDFPGDPIKLKVEVASKKLGKYILLQIEPGSSEIKQNDKKKESLFPPHDKGYSTQHRQAIRIVELYERTNFKGRVKTLETIHAEKYLSQLNHHS